MKRINIPEEHLAAQLRDEGIPFTREYLYANGRKYRSDFAVLHPRILIEVQGGIFSRQAHGSITGLLADNIRLNMATLNNWRVLRFTPDEVDDGRAITFIKQVLAIKE